MFNEVDSEDMDAVIRSYATLSSSIEFINHAGFDVSYLNELQERFSSLPERALVDICKSTRTRYFEDADAVSKACRLLAESTER